jgi:hypothetical protein
VHIRDLQHGIDYFLRRRDEDDIRLLALGAGTGCGGGNEKRKD